MNIQPARADDQADIEHLLQASGLPTADLTPALLNDFLVLREEHTLVAVVGLQCTEDAALLRSLAVAKTMRKAGIGTEMVAAAERLAKARGTRELYLLTTDASEYFTKLGYASSPRERAPEGIRRTPQFSGLCPSSSAFLTKAIGKE